MDNRTVLALDGSTDVCSVALLRLRGDAISGEDPWITISRLAKMDGRGQAKALLELADEMLQDGGHRPHDLAAVVVGTGPGTFTGVRVTVATARALALALEIPVLGVSSLGGLAAGAALAAGKPGHVHGVGGAAGAFSHGEAADAPVVDTLVPVVEARRGQVFYGVYRFHAAGAGSGKGRWVRSRGFTVCDRDRLVEACGASAGSRLGMGTNAGERDQGPGVVPRAVLIVGEGSVLPDDLPSGFVSSNTRAHAEWLVRGQDRLEEPGDLPQGARLAPWLEGTLAACRESAAWGGTVGGVGTPESVVPLYVRPPDADHHITKMRNPFAGEAGSD